ncbi:N-acetylneuraminate lyase [Microvirga pudoricolor]|uniref:N-acetylneuraminate lyase n=1 Tax=Microvirga pudoricolor TaxID=2778729 RepID=UPI001950F2C4|nr:N-acetylneuraminate lyase [Microvirga pudoricolor]MBM6593632.1 N-acetylneuraminate lyase [Microvirga pudoricolor]
MSQTAEPKFAGILSALVTPYREDGRFNPDVVPQLVDFELGQGIDGFYVGGSTGEAFIQTREERAEILKAVAQAVKGRGTLIAHVGAIGTDDTIGLGRAAAEAGYDAVSAIPPFYYDFSAEELVAHYKALASAVPLPLIVYNFGGRTGKLGHTDLLRLLDDPRIIGVKHTSQDLFQLERFKRHRPDATIYNGYDEMCLGGLAMGADGAIGTTYNFMGSLFVDLYKAFKEGRIADAHALQVRANIIIDLLIEIGVFPATKGFLKLMGVDCGGCRPPFRNLAPGDLSKIEAAIHTHLKPEKTEAAPLARAV